jgi:hypothetical protein
LRSVPLLLLYVLAQSADDVQRIRDRVRGHLGAFDWVRYRPADCEGAIAILARHSTKFDQPDFRERAEFAVRKLFYVGLQGERIFAVADRLPKQKLNLFVLRIARDAFI